MIQLYLNNCQVVVSDNTSIKLTLENQYFSSADSYTYDVTLPMTSAINRKFFGHLNRRDVRKSKMNFNATLFVDCYKILDGKAIVTSVSDTEVKVQLLGAASFYVSENKDNNTYIDKLDLGKWDDDYSFGDAQRPGAGGSSRTAESRATIQTVTAAEMQQRLGLTGEPEYVMYPIENSDTGYNINNYYFLDSAWSATSVRYRTTDENRQPINVYATRQPMLWFAAKMIASATGCQLDDEDNVLKNNTLFKRIFIASAYSSMSRADSLPHWTVSEWWQNIEKAFGVVVVIDENSNKMKIVGRTDFYNSSSYYFVGKVEDSYSTEIDDESSTDISMSNVSFAGHDNDGYELIDPDIEKQVVIDTRFANLQELIEWANPIKNDVYDDYCNYIFRCNNGRDYIIAQYVEPDNLLIYEVNQFGARIVDSDKEPDEMTINFVPCKTVDLQVDCYKYHPHYDGTGAFYEKIATTFIKGLSRPDLDSSAESQSIAVEDLIEGDEGTAESDKPDVCYIALLGSLDPVTVDTPEPTYQGANLTYPRAHTCESQIYNITKGALTTRDCGYALSLKNVDGVLTLYNETIESKVSVDVRELTYFRFLSNTIPDPSQIFVIGNKTYLCKQLEIELSGTGLNKLISGYFYQVDL